MRALRFIVVILFPLLVLEGNKPEDNTSCRHVVSKVIKTINDLKTQECTVKSIENNNGTIAIAVSFVKLNMNPKKIYYQNKEKGFEVLWVKGENDGNAYVSTRSLPFITLNLDPHGSLMRRENHHTIFDLGFQYIGYIVANTVMSSSAPGEFEKHFTLGESLVWDGIDCHQLVINYPEYKYIEHITSKKETAASIAMKYSTSDYKIRMKNDLSSFYGYIKEGEKILVPTPYAQKVIMYIDKKRFVPICVKIYDEDGLFEAYEFYNVKLNVPFAADEFSVDNKNYGF